jgi:hypothetical protein
MGWGQGTPAEIIKIPQAVRSMQAAAAEHGDEGVRQGVRVLQQVLSCAGVGGGGDLRVPSVQEISECVDGLQG